MHGFFPHVSSFFSETIQYPMGFKDANHVVICSSSPVMQDGWRKVQFKNQKRQFRNLQKRESNLNSTTCEPNSQAPVITERSL